MVAINDRVKETTTTTGQGTVNLDGAKTGFETFLERIGNGNQTYYCIAAEGGSEFEVGIGTVSSGTPNTLSRDTVLSNSDNNTNKVTFSAGTKEVFCTLPASKAILEDSANNMNVAGSIIVGGTVDGVDIATRDGVLTATATTANAALPKAGGTMTGNLVLNGANITMSGSETVDGVDISARDAVLTSTTTTATNANTTANAALPKAGGTMTGAIHFGDNVKATFGDASSPDLEIFHDGNNSFIKDVGTGGLYLRGDTTINLGVGSESAFRGTINGSVELYYDDAVKLETSATGVTVTGTLAATTVTGALSGNISQFTNNSGYITQVTTGGATTVSAGNGIGLNTGNGTITMSGTYSGSFTATGNVTAYSDERIKYNISTIENALDKVCKLRGVYYTHKQDDEENIGVIAQEVEKVVPELVSIAKTSEKPFEHLDNIRTMKYGNTVGLLIQAIKELKEYVDRSKCDCKCKES